MAIRTDFTAGEVLAAADLNDTFAAKLNIAGGKILQIVRATDATERSTTSASFVDASLSVTITPQKSDSAILLISIVSVEVANSDATSSADGFLAITDNSNNAISGAENMRLGVFTTTGTHFIWATGVCWAYSTPATTSAVTYKLRFRSRFTVSTTKLLNNTNTAQLYAIEVSA
jgi:hypothetical protein